MNSALKTLLIGLLIKICLLAGCGQYDIKVNDKIVYTPAKLLRVTGVSDPALKLCIEQAIADKLITAAIDLKDLNCSNAGIARLDGLAAFNGLEQLKLSSNRIRNLVELEKLSALIDIWLDDNVIVDIVPLAKLPKLAQLDVFNNSELQCPSSDLFASSVKIRPAKHCLAQ